MIYKATRHTWDISGFLNLGRGYISSVQRLRPRLFPLYNTDEGFTSSTLFYNKTESKCLTMSRKQTLSDCQLISGLYQYYFLLKRKGLDFSPWMPLSFKDLFLSVLLKVEIIKVSTAGQCARPRKRSVVDLQSASAKIILGLFPPSSRVTRFKLLLPAASWISFPTWKKGNGERFCTPCSWDRQWPEPAVGNSGTQQ